MSKGAFLSLLLGLTLVFNMPARCADDSAMSSQRTFYCSWDQGLKPDQAAGAESWTGTYQTEPGIHGKALKITDKPVSYLPNGNFTRDRGTLTIWFKLDATSKEDRQAIISAANFRFQIYRSKNQIFFMTGATLPEKGFKWDYSILLHNKDIPAGKWMHLALTWDRQSQVRQLFLNGKLIKSAKSERLESGPGSQSLRIGDGAAGLYDDLNIWSTVLSADEIQSVYSGDLPQAKASTESSTDTWHIEPQLFNFNYNDSIVAPGQTIHVSVPFINSTDRPQRMTAKLQVLDVWEQPVGSAQDITLNLAPGQSKHIDRDYTMDRYGCFKLRVTDANQPKLLRDVTSFACLPNGNPPRQDFFGAHVNALGTMPQMARRLGFSANRVHNMTQFTWWKRLQPEPDQWCPNAWQKQTYQRYVDLGFTNYGQWFAAPYWAVKLSTGQQPEPQSHKNYPKGWVPTDQQALRQYISRSIAMYPDIKQWEMWNEPYVSMFWNGTPDQYMQMCRVMYEQAKQTRPDLHIFAQLPIDGPWLDRVLELGILDYCDGVAYHNYFNATDHPQSVVVAVNKLRARFKQYGQESKPLINSESGVRGSTFLRGLAIPEYAPDLLKTEYKFRKAACMMIQSNVVLMSLGVKARYYYFHQPVTIHKGRAYPMYSTCEITRSPLPSAIANATLVWQLDGGSYQQQLQPTRGLRAYLFTRKDGKTMSVLWCEDQASMRINVENMQALDMMGNPLADQQHVTIADEPVFLISSADVNSTANAIKQMKIDILTKPVTVVHQAKSAIDPPLPPMPDFQVATEMGVSHMHPIDLSAFVNMGLADPAMGDGKGGWTDEGPNNDASMIEPGKHKWFGVPFVLPGKTKTDPSVITLGGMTFPSGPTSVGPIPVNMPKVRGLFFAHAANWVRGKIDEIPATYTITYQDGKTVDIPMRGGREIGNWWFAPSDEEEVRAVQLVHANPISPKHASRYLRIDYWENPRTSVPIASIILRQTNPKTTYVLCGITAVQW